MFSLRSIKIYWHTVYLSVDDTIQTESAPPTPVNRTQSRNGNLNSFFFKKLVERKVHFHYILYKPMHSAGLNGSRSLRGQWSTFESNFSRQSSKSLQTTPPLSPGRRSASTKFKSSGSMTGCHEESLDSVDDRPPTRSSSGRQKSARGKPRRWHCQVLYFELRYLV